MAFTNLSFETMGDETGIAAGWAFACQSHHEYGVFTGLSWESFELGWVAGYKFAFTGIGSDLTRALFGTGGTKEVEDFEKDWSSNQSYFFELVGLAANFDGTPEAVEDFEEDWNTNQSYKFAFVGVGTDLTAGNFDSSPEAYEDFEEDWVSGYKTSFVGVGTDLTAASFDSSPEAYEDFEENWTETMVSI